MSSTKTVSQVAALGRVTVRTLHHYDELGLLRPSQRSRAGHRLYAEADIHRLHEILTWRSLGFPLDEIQALLDDPAHDPLEAMRLHRERLAARLGGLQNQLDSLDAIIARAEGARPSPTTTGRTVRRLRPCRLRGGDPAALG